MDAKDILCGFIEELDRRNISLTDSIDKFTFMMEMYVTNILSLKFSDPFDLQASNNVEDMTYNTELFRLMQQYTVYPIYDLYKLNVNEWLDQPAHIVRFQLEMAREFKAANKQVNLSEGEDDIIIDETHKVNRTTMAGDDPLPFKRKF